MEHAKASPGTTVAALARTLRYPSVGTVSLAVGLCLAGCGYPVVQRTGEDPAECQEIVRTPLVINELMSDNEGALLDDQLETEDYFELLNVSEHDVDLSDFDVGQVELSRTQLPEIVLEPGQRALFYADDAPGQGERHMPFKLSSKGETLQLWKRGKCQRVDVVHFPALGENEVYARYPDGTGDFDKCRYASPGRSNGGSCEPQTVVTELDDVSFDSYDWPGAFPEIGEPLDINEVTLPEDDATGGVELVNNSDHDINPADFEVRLSPQPPGTPWPTIEQGIELEWVDETSVEPGDFALLTIAPDALDELGVDRNDDMVVTVFERESGDAVTRLDFMTFPKGATLARPKPGLAHLFCKHETLGAENECEIVHERDVVSRLHYIRTATDFDKLTRGGTSLDSAAFKVVIDLDAGGVVHLLANDTWDIHYTFAREVLLGLPHLDRCNAEERAEYDAGWWDYSAVNYFQAEGRRFYGATMVEHPAKEFHTMEFAVGDVITGEQMRDAFFRTVAHLPEPSLWAVRPQAADQVERARSVEGSLPLVGPNAPFKNISFQPLSVAVGYGVLEFVAAKDLDSTRLGPDVIVVTDDVPNDIPLVGGLITEAFQTPLSHVNVLSQNRKTPNMALSHAREDDRVSDHLGKLVRFEVAPSGFEITEVSADEANEFWDSRRPKGDPFAPRLDLDVDGFVDLHEASFADLPAIGGKAAQFAELYKVSEGVVGCGAFQVPARAFAIPMVHFIKHAEDSGARNAYFEALDDPDFQADYLERQRVLEHVRSLILDYPVDEDFLAQLQAEVTERFGLRRIRLRSSSNAEDLPGFNGAGLYTSEGVTLGEDDSLETALKTVWASLYSQRAHDERQLANIDHRQVAMGVLVHEAFPSERARGVGVSRNVLDPVRSDLDYINVQAGEATVTNPAPGITTEQILYERYRNRITYRSLSNLVEGHVLEPAEVQELSCALYALEQHFSSVLDPNAEDPYFAVEVEFKFLGAYRDLLVKQTRQHPIVTNDTPPECRMY